MKKSARLFILLLGITCLAGSGDSFPPLSLEENGISIVKNKLSLANQKLPPEIIYLQLDRPSYWANDDIWFKAYLQSEEDSTNIYIELINPAGKILQKKILMAIDNLAYGDFHLPDTTSSGVYQVRSYTNWMRNFGEDAFFHKDIIIWNLKDKNFEDRPETLKAGNIDLRFFPEGGTFLCGVRSRLGFKAVDENGIGIDIEGTILDDRGAFVTFFKSLYKGMGRVEFTPEEGRTYSASVTLNKKTITTRLPAAARYGVSLSLETTLPGELQITLTELSGNPDNTRYIIVGQTRGNLIFARETELVNGVYGLKIEKNKIPSGVLQVTLFDQNLIPLCERLAFINNHEYVHLSVETNQPTYKLREEVKVEISSLLKDSMPIVSNLSMSAFTIENQLRLEEYPNNILTQFLLVADLKGRIEEPAFYFRNDSKGTLVALDNLMLTQGWRRFAWQVVLGDQLPELSYEHEFGISVKGTVTTKFMEKPIPNAEVTLIFDQKAYAFNQLYADSSGRFSFNNLFFYDETPVLLQAKREKWKKNIWLEIDDRSSTSPPEEQLPAGYLVKKEKKVSTTFEISQKDSSVIQRKWHISDTILLDDIDVWGRNRHKEMEQALLYLPNPDKTVIINEEENSAANIFDYMQFTMPGVYIDFNTPAGAGPTFRIAGNSGAAYVLLDGIPVESDLIATLPFSSFERVDMLRFAPMYGIKGNNGVINFTLKRGVQNMEVPLPDGVKRLTLKGYAVIREFYSPDYSKTKPSTEKTDFRSTLFWHPNIWTDSTGHAGVQYYNSDQPGFVTIVVEGFTTDGRLCRGTAEYTVQY
ncbi:MAG: TonB-dependent receptor plug domain-containing protein [Prolixibacteraceae bacterium]|nr:TonB-dependent receptor plug domain-containing protein [Prolixibacteraceae bacterium]